MINKDSWHYKLAYGWSRDFKDKIDIAVWLGRSEVNIGLCEYNRIVIACLIKLVIMCTMGALACLLVSFALSQMVFAAVWFAQFGLDSALEYYNGGIFMWFAFIAAVLFAAVVVVFGLWGDDMRKWIRNVTHIKVDDEPQHRFWYETWLSWKNKVCYQVSIKL